jgi:cysteine desulfuration protein SufE
MNQTGSYIPPQLGEIIEDFQWSEGSEKLELLLQYAEELPPLPDRYLDKAQAMEPVEECMTPVFLQSELQDGQMVFYIDVPPSSPTVRGFASILIKGMEGLSPEEVLKVPANFFELMGLDKVLTHQRLNGISAILAHMKAQSLKHLEDGRSSNA